MHFEAGVFELDFVATVQARNRETQGAERRRGGNSHERCKEAPTEIYLNEAGRPTQGGSWTVPIRVSEALHYPEGYSTAVDPSNCLNAPRRSSVLGPAASAKLRPRCTRHSEII